MGGCRCVFRNCTVSTARNPRMHFFRFPVNDESRLLKWIKMANVPKFLDLPVYQQRNKCICARHFRDECFMNYMRDKLVHSAVPTLDRLGGRYVLDYEADDEPDITLLPETTLPHMIAPKGFNCPLYLDELTFDDGARAKDKTSCGQEETGTFVGQASKSAQIADFSILLLDEMDGVKRNVSTKPRTLLKQNSPAQRRTHSAPRTPPKKIKILNSLAPRIQLEDKTFTSQECSSVQQYFDYIDPTAEEQADYLVNTEDCYELVADEATEALPLAVTTEGTLARVLPRNADITMRDASVQAVKETDDEFISKGDHIKARQRFDFQLKLERSKYKSYENETSKKIAKLVQDLEEASLDAEMKNWKLEELKTKTTNLLNTTESLQKQNAELQEEIEKLRTTNKLQESRLEILTDEYNSTLVLKQNLEEKHSNLEEKHTLQQQVFAVKSSEKAQCVASNTITSKAQLFNGIKKYLGSSMVALLRMEMFGNAERQWKLDERHASMDLLRLGEHVYSYFMDEWRLRLPSLRQVRGWMNDGPEDACNEEDL